MKTAKAKEVAKARAREMGTATEIVMAKTTATIAKVTAMAVSMTKMATAMATGVSYTL